MFAATRYDEISWTYQGKCTSSGLLKEEGFLEKDGFVDPGSQGSLGSGTRAAGTTRLGLGLALQGRQNPSLSRVWSRAAQVPAFRWQEASSDGFQ